MMDFMFSPFAPLENDTSCIIFYFGMILAFVIVVLAFVVGLLALFSTKMKNPGMFAFQWVQSLILFTISYFIQRTLYTMCVKTL